MNIHDAVKLVSDKFVYTSDRIKIFDSWRVMREVDGVFRGDCDDFSITVFWYYSDRNLLKFLCNLLITHQYQLHFVRTITGEKHVVGAVDGLYFDNWTYCALPRDAFYARTKHKRIMRHISPLYAWFLLIGLFIR